MIRVLLVDDAQPVRRAAVSLLQEQPGIEVIGEAGDGCEAVRLVGELQPHVVVMDIRMPRMDGIEATRKIRRTWPGVRVVGLTGSDDPATVSRMIAAGAEACLIKGGPIHTLMDTIRQDATSR